MATLTGMRTTAITLALATGITFFSSPLAQAATPPTAAEAEQSGSFLSTALAANGTDLLNGPIGRTDIGLTADVIFALDALGTHPEQADRSYAAVLENLDGFTHFLSEVDAGRMAKIVALEASRGEQDPTRIAELVDAVQDNGQMKNETDGEPTSPVQNFGQSWSVIALGRVGENAAAEQAAAFLESQVCPDGGVPLFQADPPRCSSVDPDTTGLAAQAFALVYGADHPTTQATLQYLKDNIDISGGIASAYSGVNANTTALAAGAFAATGELDALAQNHSFLDSVRFDESAPTALQGAFAWRPAGMEDMTAPTDQILRTSAQAALGYAGGSYINADAVYIDQTPEEPTPDPTPDPTPEPAPGEKPAQDAAGSSEGGLIFGSIAAIIAVITAVISFTAPGTFIPTQF